MGFASIAGDHIICGSLMQEASVFTAELHTIIEAVSNILNKGVE